MGITSKILDIVSNQINFSIYRLLWVHPNHTI